MRYFKALLSTHTHVTAKLQEGLTQFKQSRLLVMSSVCAQTDTCVALIREEAFGRFWNVLSWMS